MKSRIFFILLFTLIHYDAYTQNPKFRPFFKQDSLSKIMMNFDSTLYIWPKSTGNVKFTKDTVSQSVLKAWIIESENYYEPIYAIYTDTIHMKFSDWRKNKNYIENIEKYGPGKVILFYFKDGIPLSRNDINDLRRYKEIPGQ